MWNVLYAHMNRVMLHCNAHITDKQEVLTYPP